MNCDPQLVFPSPDGRLALAFEDTAEVSNGFYVSRISVRKCDGTDWKTLGDLEAFGLFGCWNTTSDIFAVPAGSIETLFLFNVRSDCFAFVRVKLVFTLDFTFPEPDQLNVKTRPDQLVAANSSYVLGGGHCEFPVKRFKAPPDRTFNFSDLVWRSRCDLDQLENHIHETQCIDMSLIPDGYFGFQGKFPESTVQTINGRPLELWHLEEFAEYGDPQSRDWLFAAKRIAGTKYNRWHRVSRYLGVLYRQPT